MIALKYKALAVLLFGLGFACVGGAPVSATAISFSQPVLATDQKFDPSHICGAGDGVKSGVGTAIAIGCQNKGNPITDMLFAVIRFLSNGVGIVIIGSIIYAGIQYTTSGGDPQKAASAMGRIRATLIALAIYIFSYPLLNYVLPSGFFK
jgi:hypothetical protein